MLEPENEITFLTDKEIDEIISNLSDEIVTQCILDNIDKQEKQSNYYLEDFYKNYKMLKEKYSENNDILEKINEATDNLFVLVLNRLEEKFKFVLNIEEDMNVTSIYDIILDLNEFFVYRKLTNINNLIMEYIDKESNALIEKYSKTTDITNIFFNNYSANLLNGQKIILMNIHNIINDINFESNEEIIELICQEDMNELVNENIFDLFITKPDAVSFQKDFKENYLNIIQENLNYIILMVKRSLVEKYI